MSGRKPAKGAPEAVQEAPDALAAVLDGRAPARAQDDVDVASAWEERIAMLLEIGQRLRMLDAYVAVLEERVEQMVRGEDPPLLYLIPGGASEPTVAP